MYASDAEILIGSLLILALGAAVIYLLHGRNNDD